MINMQEALHTARLVSAELDLLISAEDYLVVYSRMKDKLRPRSVANDILNIVKLAGIVEGVPKDSIALFYSGQLTEEVLEGLVAVQLLLECGVPYNKNLDWWKFHLKAETPLILDYRARIAETIH